MTKGNYKPKRYWPRLETTFPVQCSGKGSYNARNIGNRGIFLEGLNSISPGRRISIRFQIPGWQYPYRLVAEVTHRDGLKTPEGIIPGSGLKFVGAIVGKAALSRTENR